MHMTMTLSQNDQEAMIALMHGFKKTVKMSELSELLFIYFLINFNFGVPCFEGKSCGSDLPSPSTSLVFYVSQAALGQLAGQSGGRAMC